MFESDVDLEDGDVIPFVTFRLYDAEYGISAAHVRTMLETPAVTPVPHAPPYVRGIINPRGQTLPLVDLRMRLGLPSARQVLQEFTDMLGQREQDHRNWLDELEKSVQERRPFTLTTDPHECAFGRWYDSFATDNLTLQSIVHKFDAPHRRIHALADQVKRAEAAGDYELAAAIIRQAHDTDFARLVQLFADVKEFYRVEARETVLVLEAEGYVYAVAVDAVTAVEAILDENLTANPVGRAGDTTAPMVAMGRRTGTDTVIQVLDPGRVCQRAEVAAVTPQPV